MYSWQFFISSIFLKYYILICIFTFKYISLKTWIINVPVLMPYLSTTLDLNTLYVTTPCILTRFRENDCKYSLHGRTFFVWKLFTSCLFLWPFDPQYFAIWRMIYALMQTHVVKIRGQHLPLNMLICKSMREYSLLLFVST